MTDDAVGTEQLHESSTTRVWLLALEPGEATDWHQHTCDYVYVVVQPARNRTEYEDGSSSEKEEAVGDAFLTRRGQRHRLVNVGTNPYMVVVVELLGTRPT
jgi:quercetin dioxygenase-like cupin family protein